jgi:hypothetical protein
LPLAGAGLGFLGPSPFPCENPRSDVLDFLGFPWILSSETRLINGLRGIKRGNFFRSAYPGVEPRRTRVCGQGHAEAPDWSSGKLNLISNFLQ